MPLPDTSIRALRGILMFSRSLATAASRSASRFALGSVASFLTTSSQKARKSSLRATKSVSQLISTRTPRCPPGAMYWAITPFARLAGGLLGGSGGALLRRISTAASKSPLVSVSAFLQSIMPALVISRSLATAAAVISAMFKIRLYTWLTVKSKRSAAERSVLAGSHWRRSR